jgi:hypothetical protein
MSLKPGNIHDVCSENDPAPRALIDERLDEDGRQPERPALISDIDRSSGFQPAKRSHEPP